MNKVHFTTCLTPELLCTNIEVSLSFYIEILDFNIQYQRPEEGFAMLESQGTRLMLEEIVPGSSRSWIAVPLEKPFGRGINLQIETTDVDKLYTRVQRAGGKIFLSIEEKWYREDNVELGNRQFIV